MQAPSALWWTRVFWLALGSMPMACTTLLGEDFSGYQTELSNASGAAGEAGAREEAGIGAAGAEPVGAAGESAGDAGTEATTPSSCFDRKRNGGETGVDCGGAECGPCTPGSACGWAGDCTSGVCANGICQTPTCLDFVRNGDETDVDCGGGLCLRCEDNHTCNSEDDCASGFCRDGTCTNPICGNGVQDPGESDVDCGGSACPRCHDGSECDEDDDCANDICRDATCKSPSCTDGIVNGNEADVDCGGGTCPKCADGAACSSGADCEAGACIAGACKELTCPNGDRDGDETDVDCGGAWCRGCAAGRSCTRGSDCLSGSCEAGSCSRCVNVHVAGEGSYCIDVTEVTQAQYAAFLAAKGGDTAGQSGACSWNADFSPAVGTAGCHALDLDAAADSDLPVTCVDWCDAAAYCAWAGMRLCGGLSGGAGDYNEFGDPKGSQWSHACTVGGETQYPYGDGYDPAICNASGYGAGAPIAVGEAPACRASAEPLALVRDLSGNVWEWEDACKKNKNESDPCRARGGSFSTANPACNADEKPTRATARPDLGFRCCS